MNAIEVNNLTKVYKLYKSPRDRLRELISLNRKKHHHEFYAMKDVSFTVEKGQTIGIIGQNGSGKSTLLKIICDVLKPSSGSVKVNGRISSLLELGAGFNPEFTGRENVYMNGALMGLSRAEIDSHLPEIEAFAEIGEFIDQPVKVYSSGMYVRLAFAAAINADPDILVIDEALTVGDSRFQLKCFLKFQEFQEKQKTILFVTHDMNTIKKYCSFAILLDRGALIFRGFPNEVVNRYSKIMFPRNKVMIDKVNMERAIMSDEDLVTYELEYRYGSGEGEIANLNILNSDWQNTLVFTSGEKMIVVFHAIAKHYIDKPILAMTIKDVKGQEIYATNTYVKGMHLSCLNPGSSIEVSFSQKLNLIANSYFISLGFVHIDNGNITPLDRRYDVVEIKVLPKDMDLSMGIANLDSDINVKYCENNKVDNSIQK